MAGERGGDDEALRWEGDEETTLEPGWKRVGPATRAASEPSSSASTAGASDDSGAEPGSAEGSRAAQPGSAELVLLGVLGGAYLLYTLGWILTVLRVENPAVDPVGSFMFALGLWLAALAPALWFGVVFALTRGRVRLRFIWLVIGIVVLLPVAFVAGVSA
ncbi:hypothetical protein [Agromyces sp. SYSU T0242]|uniref:hypothetical protein n=1 Tax=Agromyces litoreus TaxID=3158561 RepID=UPI0033924BD3